MKEQILNYKKGHVLEWNLIIGGALLLTLFLNYFLTQIAIIN